MKNIKLFLSLSAALLLGLSACNDDFTQPPVPEAQGGFVGTGAWDNPMSAWQAYKLSSNPMYPEAWVSGYIVGVINTDYGFVVNKESAQFEAPFGISSNMLITWLDPEKFEAIPDDEKWEYTTPVQLVANTQARSVLNLVDNPDNLAKTRYKAYLESREAAAENDEDTEELTMMEICGVTLKGSTGSNYMGAGGVRSVSDYNWGAIGREAAQEGMHRPAESFYQNFSKYSTMEDLRAAGWNNVVEQGKFVGWVCSQYGKNRYLAVDATLAYQQGGPYQATMMSVPVDLNDLDEKVIEFDSQVANADETTTLTFSIVSLVAEPTDENPAGEWSAPVQLSFAEPDAVQNQFSEWKNSGKINLDAYQGVVRFCWTYNAQFGGEGNCATYCIDNVNVGNHEVPVEVVLGTDQVAPTMLDSSTTDSGWTFQNVSLGSGLSYVWSWNANGYLNGSAYKGGAVAAKAYAISPEISLVNVSGSNVTFDHAAKFQTTCRELCGFAVREVGSDDWTEIEIPNWPTAGSWSFASSGQIDISAFDGKRVEVALIYGSSSAGADTWEIKNLKVLGFK